jgi:hypothetical protein
MWAPRSIFYSQTWSCVKLPLGFQMLKQFPTICLEDLRKLTKILSTTGLVVDIKSLGTENRKHK